VEGPVASVVVVTYNSERWIRGCLRALRAQAGAPPYEIIVVDSGSADGTADIVSAEFPEVRLLRGENRGFGAGNNAGAAVARGTLLAFVNPDTVAEPGWLRELLAPLSEPGVVTTSKVLLLDAPGKVNTCGNVLHFTGLSFVLGLGGSAEEFQGVQPVPGISGAAFAMRRDDYLRLGGFDEGFFLYLEDTDLSWRLRRSGFRVLLAPASRVLHSYRFSLTPGKLYHVELGRLRLLRKHYRPFHWVLLAPSLLLADALAWAAAARMGREGLRAKLRATREGWRQQVERFPPGDQGGVRGWMAWRFPKGVFGASRLLSPALALCSAIFWLNTLPWRIGKGARRGA
jgi:GT2 family glycosyltransferase